MEIKYRIASTNDSSEIAKRGISIVLLSVVNKIVLYL